MDLILQYLSRCAERGGLFWEFERGIALGCALSPIMGAFFLAELDASLEALGLFYIRYMDDILVLSPTRWRLRKAIRLVNEALRCLGLEKHPDKTFIGRIEHGFEFLGYHFSPRGLGIAAKTRDDFLRRAVRLYEREGGDFSSPLESYVRRWSRWATAGLGDTKLEVMVFTCEGAFFVCFWRSG